ncbi:MAG: prephenate dehydratase [Solirubrobacterales bacterium]|nr:prephenate dehydratase [Solirubrobacterales bacterium]
MTRAGYLGPEGTFTHAAVLATPGSGELELVALPTIVDTVQAVADGEVALGLVPIENSIEGSVSATLDTLSMDTQDVSIVGEVVQEIEQCLIGPAGLALEEIEVVASHPQASAQCAHYLHRTLPHARVMTTTSTADAVRLVSERGGNWAALGPRVAAERYGASVLVDSVEDHDGNRTRFVWLARRGGPVSQFPAGRRDGAWKTSIVFWGQGTDQPGWLVRCLSELSERGVNMTRIESRPLKQRLGEYMFFIDCSGASDAAPLSAALPALRRHVEVFRALGSYPAA